MTVDWSKAPYDAEAGYCGTSQAYDAWYRRDGSGQVQQMCPAAGYSDWTWMGGRKDFPVGAELRPATERQWNGEGLPPAGTVCELRTISAHIDWNRAVIKFASRNVIVWDWEDEPSINGLCTSYAHAVELRPIRTAEQIAAVERKKAIGEMIDIYKSNYEGLIADGCQALYDAGYRKQEAAQ